MLDLEARKTGIGGSDAAAALGLSQWKTPYELWLEKTGQPIPFLENEAMKWGKIHEPQIRQEYCNRHGVEMIIPTEMTRSIEHPFMVANTDGILLDRSRGWEGKTAKTDHGFGEEGTDEVPQAYLIQCVHYMIVEKIPVWDLSVLIGGSDYREYTIEEDASLKDMVINEEGEFWHKVTKEIPPEAVSAEDVRRRWALSVDKSIPTNEEVSIYIEDLKKIKNDLAQFEDAETILKKKIQEHMKDADTIIGLDGKPLITWKSAKPSVRLDGEMVKAVYPEVWKACSKETQGSRRFLVK